MSGILSQMIEKYGGEDEAYKLKLKENIRGAFGYSNYVNKANAAAGKPLSLNLKGNITPGGIKSLVGGAINMQEQEVSAYDKMAGAIDTQAGSLASAQAAREKAAAAKAKEELGRFKPEDWLDRQIYDFQANRPKKEDGKEMTSEEFKQQLEGQLMGEGDLKDVLFQKGISFEMIDQRLKERLPEDFNERRAFYQAKLVGATNAEAEYLQKYDNYVNNKMSDGDKWVYERLDPTAAGRAKVEIKNKEMAEMTDDLTPKQDINPETGEPMDGKSLPFKTFAEFKHKYIGKYDEETIKEAAYEPYRLDTQSDARIFVKEMVNSALEVRSVGNWAGSGSVYGVNKWANPSTWFWFENINITPEKFIKIQETAEYKSKLKALELINEGILTPKEIEQEMFMAFTEYPELLRRQKEIEERNSTTYAQKIADKFAESAKNVQEKRQYKPVKEVKQSLSEQLDEDMKMKQEKIKEYLNNFNNFKL